MFNTCQSTHAFNRRCVEDVPVAHTHEQNPAAVASRVSDAVASRWCPRCETESLPTTGHHPGSVVTPCGCIPICVICMDHEGLEGPTLPDKWPMEPAPMRDRVIQGYVDGDVCHMTGAGRLVPALPPEGSSLRQPVVDRLRREGDQHADPSGVNQALERDRFDSSQFSNRKEPHCPPVGLDP
jgi:hypothetical protein